MKQLIDILEKNAPYDWALMLGTVIAVLLVIAVGRRLLVNIIMRLARRTPGKLDDAIGRAMQSTSLLVMSPVALYAGATMLELPDKFDRLLSHLAVVALLVQFGLWANRFLVEMQAIRTESKRIDDPAGATALNLIGFGVRTLVWALILLVSLARLGIDITALVAGLGIGGIAVALALQNILGDLFASLSIVLDKPFVVGDFIIVGDFLGTVEHVGIKTTRLRSLGGEMLIMSNADLLQSRVRNYKQMRERRIVFSIGVAYQTPAEKLRKLPGLIKTAVGAQENVRFDRAHFKDFGDSSLNFETVYYVLSRDFAVYMDIQQAINLALFESFAKLGVEFAYPTRTIHIESMPALPTAATAEKTVAAADA